MTYTPLGFKSVSYLHAFRCPDAVQIGSFDCPVIKSCPRIESAKLKLLSKALVAYFGTKSIMISFLNYQSYRVDPIPVDVKSIKGF